jgi:hypothetical protein
MLLSMTFSLFLLKSLTGIQIFCVGNAFTVQTKATVYSMFRGEATEKDLAEAGHKGG